MILQALDRYYDRMAARGEAEAPGYSREKISYAIVLSADGVPIDVIDFRTASGKKLVPVQREVPAAVKRTVAILPNLLWDKTSYALGRTGGEGRRTADEHAAFKALHAEVLADVGDEGLAALRRFLETWTPERFDTPPFLPDMLDTNVVFRLDGDRGLVHEREAARRLAAGRTGGGTPTALCLVTGIEAPVARLHPSIKGVEGAQSSGAALVSFNLDAFKSYGKEQGANAPTSEAAAFRYGAALNRMLDRGSKNRVARRIGDATVVFWADASSLEPDPQVADRMAGESEDAFAGLFDPPPEKPPQPAAVSATDESESAKFRDALGRVAQGRPAREVFPGVTEGVRFHVLGLAPNAARLSVRFWLADTFEHFVDRLGAHWRDLAIEPKPRDWGDAPAIQRLLVKTTALQEKFENIPPLLAGEVTRAVLGGTRYPRTLLAAALMRLRAGDDPGTGWHAAAIRAVLARDARLAARAGDPHAQEPPVSLDRNDPSPAYQLGRLFATLETAQRQALGKVNATIRDRYFGAASATPASVFPLLLRGVQSHLGKLRKDGKGGWIEREIEEITDRLPPALPRSLKLDAQGRFAIGYYHQRRAQFTSRGDETETGETQDGDE